jgi:hypothetical protein
MLSADKDRSILMKKEKHSIPSLICMSAIILLMAFACAKAPVAHQPSVEDLEARQVYEQARSELAGVVGDIDYDTLISVYETLAGTEVAVPHVDELLFDLLAKRNKDSRLDQMIVIFCADIIGRSRYPIARVSELFDTILQMDDDRIDNWVLIFVADALGRYPIDLPDGDRLADLVEARVQQAAQSHDPSKERFGQHFLPPPKSRLIIHHIEAIEDQERREKERDAYYWLVLRQHTEDKIEAGLNYLKIHGRPETGEKCPLPLLFLTHHWDTVQRLMSTLTD